MKRTIVTSTIFVLIALFLFSSLLSSHQMKVLAAQEMGGILAGDTIWTAADSPYDLTADLVIPNGTTLMIQAGVTVNGHHHAIRVLGTLNFMGPSSPSTVLVDVSMQISGRVITGGSVQYATRNTHNITYTTTSDGVTISSEVVEVEENASKTFIVDTPSGQYLRNVIVDGVSLGPVSSYTFDAIQSDHAITVAFSHTKAFNVTTTATSGGTITPSGIVTVDEGSGQGFSIQADANSHIADVKVDGLSVGAVSSYSFANVTADHSIEASFTVDTYVIAASAGFNGSISPNGTVTVDKGVDQAFIITRSAGYHVADVVVDGTSVGAVTSYSFTNTKANHTIQATFAINAKSVIELKIGSKTMYADGKPVVLEAAPIILNSRTLLPIRAVVEAAGGTITWEASTRKVTIVRKGKTLELWIGKNIAKLNGTSVTIDSDPKVVPIILSGRTLLPLRFVAEALAMDIQWNATTKAITITYTP